MTLFDRTKIMCSATSELHWWHQALLKSCECGLAPQEKEACNNSVHGVWGMGCNWKNNQPVLWRHRSMLWSMLLQGDLDNQPERWPRYRRSRMPVPGSRNWLCIRHGNLGE